MKEVLEQHPRVEVPDRDPQTVREVLEQQPHVEVPERDPQTLLEVRELQPPRSSSDALLETPGMRPWSQ